MKLWMLQPVLKCDVIWFPRVKKCGRRKGDGQKENSRTGVERSNISHCLIKAHSICFPKFLFVFFCVFYYDANYPTVELSYCEILIWLHAEYQAEG